MAVGGVRGDRDGRPERSRRGAGLGRWWRGWRLRRDGRRRWRGLGCRRAVGRRRGCWSGGGGRRLRRRTRGDWSWLRRRLLRRRWIGPYRGGAGGSEIDDRRRVARRSRLRARVQRNDLVVGRPAERRYLERLERRVLLPRDDRRQLIGTARAAALENRIGCRARGRGPVELECPIDHTHRQRDRLSELLIGRARRSGAGSAGDRSAA